MKQTDLWVSGGEVKQAGAGARPLGVGLLEVRVEEPERLRPGDPLVPDAVFRLAPVAQRVRVYSSAIRGDVRAYLCAVGRLWLTNHGGCGRWADVDQAVERVLGARLQPYLIGQTSSVVQLARGLHIVAVSEEHERLVGSFDGQERGLAEEELRLLRDNYPEQVYELRLGPEEDQRAA